MEYEEHLALIIVPTVFAMIAITVIFVCIAIFLPKGKFLSKKVVTVVLGDVLNNDDDDDDDDDDEKAKHFRWAMYGAAIAVLNLSALVWWFTLVEQITAGECIPDADCFISGRYHFGFGFQRANCSTFQLTNDLAIFCYRAGFYLYDAFGNAGGILAIVSTVSQLFLPAAILFINGHKWRKRLVVTATGIGAVLSFAIFFIVALTLPSSAVARISGPAIFPVLSLFFVFFLIAFAMYYYPV